MKARGLRFMDDAAHRGGKRRRTMDRKAIH